PAMVVDGSALTGGGEPALHELDQQQQDEGDDEHHDRQRRCAGVVVLLELGYDQQGRDLGFHRHVARDENDGAVLPDRPRECQGEAGQYRWYQRRHDNTPDGLQAGRAQRGGGLLELRFQFLEDRLDRAHHERQADEGERDPDADRRVSNGNAERIEQRSEPAVLREQAGQRDARNRGWQRE